MKDVSKSFENKLRKSKTANFEFKKFIKKFKYFRNYPNKSKIIKTCFIALHNKNSSTILAKYLSYLLSDPKIRHTSVLPFLNKILILLLPLKLSKILGLKIMISGRFNGFSRSKKKFLKIGELPLKSFDSDIKYSKEISYTPNGTFGVKVWVYYYKNY